MATQTNTRTFSIPFELTKLDEEKRLVTGWVAVTSDDNGNQITDSDGHVIPIEELEKAVHKAASQGGAGKVGDLHDAPGVGDFVEWFVVDAKKRSALGFGPGREGWAASLKITSDAEWELVKRGDRPELSMRGSGLGTPIPGGGYVIRDIELNKVEWASLVDKGASGNDSARPSIVLWKSSKKEIAASEPARNLSKEKQMDPTVELALDSLGLNAKQKEAVVAMLEAAKGPAGAPPAPKPEDKPAPDAAMPEEMKKRFNEERVARVELEKRNAELADRLLTVELSKRAAELQYVPEKPDEIVAILKAAKVAGVSDKIDALLTKVNKAMETSPIMRAHGAAIHGNDAATTEKLHEIAKRYREQNPKMTVAAAFKRACNDNPELYTQARNG